MFLFKRPYNPEYQRRILTVLGLPCGLTFEVPYRQKYLAPDIREAVSANPSLFEGKKAVSFCVDSRPDQNILTFCPLRECVIRKVWQPEGSDFVNFLFEVEGYPLVEPGECTKELTEKYGKEGLPPQREDAFVISGEKLNCITSAEFSEANWERIAQHLSSIPELAAHAFYQLLAFSDQRGRVAETEDIDSYRGIKLSGGKKYRVRLAVRLPHHYESSGRYSTKMSVTLGSGLESVGDSEVEIRTAYETKDYFEFVCKKVNQKSKLTIQEAEDPFSAPKFDICVRISSLPKWVNPTVAIILLAAASALGALGQPWYGVVIAAVTGLLYYAAIHILLR